MSDSTSPTPPSITDLVLAIEDLLGAHLIHLRTRSDSPDSPDSPNPLPTYKHAQDQPIWIDQQHQLRVTLHSLLAEAHQQANLEIAHGPRTNTTWLHHHLTPNRLSGTHLRQALLTRGWTPPTSPTMGRRYWTANPTLTTYLLDPTDTNWAKLPALEIPDPDDE